MGRTSFEERLRASAVRKETLDRFLDPDVDTFATFDPDCGYRLKHCMMRDGIDGSYTISTAVETSTARTPVNYVHVPRRLNTYGDSFTQCHQVSDGETWQEYLAAHLGEPIGNFGMGGYGVYQSYRRMIRTEASAEGRPWVILYLWGDDHLRSILRCRHAVINRWWDNSGELFHNPFWANVEMNLETGALEERENRLATPEALYRMTDPDFMYESLKDDLMAQMLLYVEEDIDGIDRDAVVRLAQLLGVPAPDGRAPRAEFREALTKLMWAYGFAATRRIVRMSADWAARSGKRILFVLFCPKALRELLSQGSRYDQTLVDYFRESGVEWFDMTPVHVADYTAFRCGIDAYFRRYFIGHYSPAGNHFFAFAIKDRIVNWLDPRPVTYLETTDRIVRFHGYLRGWTGGSP